jgi:hypothetical protein
VVLQEARRNSRVAGESLAASTACFVSTAIHVDVVKLATMTMTRGLTRILVPFPIAALAVVWIVVIL